MTNILAIDQGTSGTKAIVADEGGQVLAIAEQPLQPLHQLRGAFVTDASTASRSLLTGLDDAAWNSELPPPRSAGSPSSA